MAAELVPNNDYLRIGNHKAQGGPTTAMQHPRNSYSRGPGQQMQPSVQQNPVRPYPPPSSHRDATCEYPMPAQSRHPTFQVPTLSVEDRVCQLEQTILVFLQKIYEGHAQWVADSIAQTQLENEAELVLIARIIVSKALDEPQHSEACAVLSKTLHTCLPAVPPTHPGRKAESFMHAVLDAFQTEFETLMVSPSAPAEGNTVGLSLDSTQVSAIEHRKRLRAAVEFAGYLHCQGLLGSRVVEQIVHDLVGTGAPWCARELLRKIGVILETHERSGLSTVVEASSDSDGEAT